MKKIFSLIIAIAICFSGAALAAYLPQDVQGTEFESDVELMINLGLMDYSDEGMFKPYSHMTRAEFAQLLDGILAKKASSGKDAFLDVGEDHFARESINRLYQYGYVNGDGNSYFRADDDITYNEAVRVLVSILGYDRMAQYNGGYPSGYLSVGSSTGITKGVSADGEYINRGNIIRLLVNSFDANLVEVTFENGRPVCKVNEEKTMLSEMAGIYWMKDYVNANSDYGIGRKEANDGYIIIGNEEMKASVEYQDYVGYFVTCYYRENDSDDFEVIYLDINENKNEFMTVNAGDIYSAEGYSCTILADKKEKSLKFTGETIFIYNGKLLKNFNPDMLIFDNGWVEFIDNNSDGRYEVVKISEYYNTVVEAVTEDSIYDKYNLDGTIDLESADIRIYDETGEDLSISDIAAGDVLSVFKSGDDKEEDIIKLVRSRKTISGTADRIDEKDGDIFVMIGGTEYRVYNGYKTTQTDKIFLKDSGEFLLDAYGKIVSMKSFAAGVLNPAYMIQVKAYIDETTGEEVIRFKFLTESGVIYVMGREKIKVDGIRVKSSEFENYAKSLQGYVNQVVLYKVNSKGDLTVLDTVDKNTAGDRDDSLSAGPAVAATTSLRYKAVTKVFEGKFAIEDSAKVFLVPADVQNADDSEFSFRDASYFISDQSYKGLQTYRSDSSKIPVDYVVLQASTSIMNNESDIAVVKSISRTINEDDEEVVSIDVYANGAEKSFVTSSVAVAENVKYITKYSRAGDTLVDFEGAKPELGVGDLIKYSFNSDGAIECIAIIFSAGDNKLYSVNPYHTDFHERGQRYASGTVDKKYGGYIELNVNGSIECHNIGSAEIFEVNPDEKEVLRKISQAEIKDSEKYGTGDTVIVVTLAGAQKMTLLYR